MSLELPEDIQNIVDEMRELAEDLPVPLDLPDEDDLVLIEEELLLPFPIDYKRFLVSLSDVVYGALEPLTVADPSSYNHLPEVTAQAWADGLPRHMLPFCRDAESLYCLDANGEVFIWQNEELSDVLYESIWDWVRDVWLEY